MSSVELIKSGESLAMNLACDGLGEYSDTAHRITAALADLTRWEWLPRGRGVSLCRGGIGAPHGGTDRAESWVSRSGRGGEVTYEYRVTHSSDSGGNFDNEPPVPPADSKGWRLHSHSTCYDTDGRTVRITYVWEREARP